MFDSHSRTTAALVVAGALAGLPGAAAGQDAASAEAGAVRIAVIGDSGSGNADQKAVARQMRRVEGSLRHVFLLGDNVYFTGQANRFEKAFHRPYRRFLERRTPRGEPQIAFHSALGNHDVARTCELTPDEDGVFARDRDAYGWRDEGCDVEEQLADPAFGYRDQNRYYQVDVPGPDGEVLAEVFVLDSNTLPSEHHPDREDTKQLDWWKESMLASRARADEAGHKPWRIVTLHHPVRTPRARGYLFGFGGHQEDATLFEALEAFVRTLKQEEAEIDRALESRLEPVLAGSAVDAVFAGHNHFYARLRPDDDGIRHFVAGGGGIAVYEPDLESGPSEAGGGFHHFVTAVLTRDRFEYCTIDSLGRVRDHGYWERGMKGDQPLDDDRYQAVCRP